MLPDSTNDILVRLFQRHFPDSRGAVHRLNRHLEEIVLPFNFTSQLREVAFPSQPEFPTPDSFIYYYVPNSGWGSLNNHPNDFLDSKFVSCADGVGLNLGCPVRLLKALDALSILNSEQQRDVRIGIKNPTQHLATVEELLWLTGWESLADIGRPGPLIGAAGDVDWAFAGNSGTRIYLESKFRPSDWPRFSDKGTFVPMQGSFLGKAAHKFPRIAQRDSIHVVGITAYVKLTEEVAHLIGKELENTPQVHAVVFRTLDLQPHVLSLHNDVVNELLASLSTPSFHNFPTNYYVSIDIEKRERRVLRRMLATPDCSYPSSPVICEGKDIQDASNVVIPIFGSHRCNITHAPGGEPIFEMIPKYLWPDNHERA